MKYNNIMAISILVITVLIGDHYYIHNHCKTETL